MTFSFPSPIRALAKASVYGRPAGLVTIAEYLARNPDAWRLSVPAEPLRHGPPRRHGRREADLTALLDPFPDLGVLAVRGGSILGPHGWVFTEDRRFLFENSWHGRHATAALLPRHFEPVTNLSGVCLNITSDYSRYNYGHFLLDSLGRFGLFQKAGMNVADVDYIFCPRPRSRSALQMMEALGVPPHKCIWAQETRYVRADTVLSTSFPGARRNFPPWLVEYLRTVPHAPSASGKRIYVPRAGERRVSNEAELLPILREFGFEVYDFTQHEREADFFASVTHIVGAHGSGLINIVFCRPGAKVLELIPSDHVFPYFYTLAESAGLDYRYLLGESQGQRPVGEFGRSPYDFKVDVEEFRAALSDITAGAGNQ